MRGVFMAACDTIECVGELVKVEPTGENCCVCDCKCLLSQFDVLVSVNGNQAKPIGVVMCESCRDMYEAKQ